MLAKYTLGVLSWGSPKTLRNTLQSYDESRITFFAGEKLIYFQEISAEDIKIAKEFGYEYEGNSRNVGIAEGYGNLLRRAKEDQFMFCENDWQAIETPNDTITTIALATTLISEDVLDLFRLRSRENPGEPLHTRQFQGREYVKSTHLFDALHWEDQPEKFPEIQEFINGVYFTSSKYANWTNNPTLARTKFLQEYILPRLKGDIEKNLQAWWEQQSFRIGAGRGLFTHNRLDR